MCSPDHRANSRHTPWDGKQTLTLPRSAYLFSVMWWERRVSSLGSTTVCAPMETALFKELYCVCVCVCVCVVCMPVCVFIWVHTPTELSKRLHCQCVIEERGRDRSGTGEDLINLHVNAPRQIESPVSSCSEWGKQQPWLPHTYTSTLQHITHTQMFSTPLYYMVTVVMEGVVFVKIFLVLQYTNWR